MEIWMSSVLVRVWALDRNIVWLLVYNGFMCLLPI